MAVACRSLASTYYGRRDAAVLWHEAEARVEELPVYTLAVLMPAVVLAPVVFVVGWKLSTPLVYEILRRRDAQSLGKSARNRFRCSVGAGIVGAAMAMALLILADAPVLYFGLRHAVEVARSAQLASLNATADLPPSVSELADLVASPHWYVATSTSAVVLVAVGVLLAVHTVVGEFEMVSLHRTLNTLRASRRVDDDLLHHYRFPAASLEWNCGKVLRLRTLVVEGTQIATTVALQAVNLVGMCATYLDHAAQRLPHVPLQSESALLFAATALYAACGAALATYSLFAASANQRGQRWLIMTPRSIRWAPFGVVNLVASVTAVAVRSAVGIASTADAVWLAVSLLLFAQAVAAGFVARSS